DALPFRAIKEGELYFQEDREVNLVELALATNIPKGCAETAVRGCGGARSPHGGAGAGLRGDPPPATVPSAVSTLTDDLLKYYQHVTRAVLGDDPQLMKVGWGGGGGGGGGGNGSPLSLVPVPCRQVKSVSHDLEQLNRLLHIARSLIQNPFLCLGSYVRSLITSVIGETVRGGGLQSGPRRNGDWSVCPVSRRTHGDLVSGLYHQILLSLQKVLADPVRPLCSHYGAVVGLHALGWK
ncbi:TAF6L factor, partial [Scopus umbretta]|nr:TAF6L factor [Scopus umbretta]